MTVTRWAAAAIAGFSFFVALVLAALLQREQVALERQVAALCEQRKLHVQQVNTLLDGLAEVERHNTVASTKIRLERIRLYESSKLPPPTC